MQIGVAPNEGGAGSAARNDNGTGAGASLRDSFVALEVNDAFSELVRYKA
jgi:hypothetical protein